jgi:multiple sugar transport system ATP-binding protein
MADIEFRGVSKRYPDGTSAIRTMDLRIEDGELMILVGPSGCGKSTALRLLAGLEEPTEGALLIGGCVVNDLPPRDRDIAMVFQSYALYPQMTVAENMAFGLRMRKVGKQERGRRVLPAAQVLDLEHCLHKKPARLSGGQRQRVAMGRAIVREPSAFLMDEPLSNLDAKLRGQMRAEVSRLQRRLGTTMVYVTHDQVEAMTLGDRVAVMCDGVLQQVDTPRELYANPANLFVASFIGSPPMNFFDGTLDRETVRTPIGDVPIPAELRRGLALEAEVGGDVVLGVRPEDLEDADFAADGSGFTFEAAVELTESIGPDLFVHFASEHADAEPRRGVARVDPASRARAGGRVRLGIATDRIHVFDQADGRALSTGRAGAETAVVDG